MNKSEWDEIRKRTELPLIAFYHYWQETKPSHFENMSIGQFAHNFAQYTMYAQEIPIMDTKRVYRRFDYKNMSQKIIEYYDNKFGY